jgi:hypothetical protein
MRHTRLHFELTPLKDPGPPGTTRLAAEDSTLFDTYRIVRAVPDVVIFADTVRSPELRHEIPLAIPDPFLYIERNGDRHVVIGALELPACGPSTASRCTRSRSSATTSSSARA